MEITLETIKAKSERLYELRREIDRRDEEHSLIMEPLKAERDMLQGELVGDMEQAGLASLKVASGDTFTKAVRKSVAIVNEFFALEWAKKNGAIKIDAALVAQKIKEGAEVPADAFRPTETAYISVRKAKKEDTINQ